MSDKISTGVMKTYESKNFVMYRAMCDCQDGDHDATISFEYDKEFNEVELHFYKKTAWCTNWNDPWYKSAWRRIRDSLKMLITGYIELDDDFLIRDQEHIDNVITAMIDGRVMMRRTQEEERMKESKPSVVRKMPETIKELNEEIEKGF